jgi:hypothetical protein
VKLMSSSVCSCPVFAAWEHSDVSAFSFPLSAFPGWPDFTTPTRQLTLAQPTDEPEVIGEAALRLFDSDLNR